MLAIRGKMFGHGEKDKKNSKDFRESIFACSEQIRTVKTISADVCRVYGSCGDGGPARHKQQKSKLKTKRQIV